MTHARTAENRPDLLSLWRGPTPAPINDSLRATKTATAAQPQSKQSNPAAIRESREVRLAQLFGRHDCFLRLFGGALATPGLSSPHLQRRAAIRRFAQ